jgi:AcrR family transcriptional regulator
MKTVSVSSCESGVFTVVVTLCSPYAQGYEHLLVFGTRVPMVKKKAAHEALKPRKTPMQKRSAETVSVILEAAARVLELDGFEGFNTNAIAKRAGVSVGSLYQYFRSKDALLSGLMEREAAPLLAVTDELIGARSCKAALRTYIQASIRHQMKRPRLARLIDVAEKRETFNQQVSGTVFRLHAVMEDILKLQDAPKVRNRGVAAADLLAIIRGLIDAAGERGENESDELLQRTETAVWGYLRSPGSKA